MAVNYDEHVIHGYADALYSRAQTTIVVQAMLGAVVGAGFGFAIGNFTGGGGAGLVAGAVVLGLLGYAAGASKAGELRLAAQVALCQAQIEKNTRGSAKLGSTATVSASAADAVVDAPAAVREIDPIVIPQKLKFAYQDWISTGDPKQQTRFLNLLETTLPSLPHGSGASAALSKHFPKMSDNVGFQRLADSLEH